MNSLKLMQSLVIVWQTLVNVSQMFGGCLVDNHWTSLSGHCPPNIWQMFTRVCQSLVDNVGDCEILNERSKMISGILSHANVELQKCCY